MNAPNPKMSCSKSSAAIATLAIEELRLQLDELERLWCMADTDLLQLDGSDRDQVDGIESTLEDIAGDAQAALDAWREAMAVASPDEDAP